MPRHKVTIFDLLAREGKLPYREHWKPLDPQREESQAPLLLHFGKALPVPMILPPGYTLGFTNTRFHDRHAGVLR